MCQPQDKSRDDRPYRIGQRNLETRGRGNGEHESDHPWWT